jgi:predicted nucleic acid-binding protein
MTALVDSNVLIDIAYRDPAWLKWSRQQVTSAIADGPLVINQIIFAEFSFRYALYDEADALLPHEEFRREDVPFMAAFAAAKAFSFYRRAGGAKEKPLPDFFIGAHAMVRGYQIITRDPSGFRAYFPDVELITPDTHPLKGGLA